MIGILIVAAVLSLIIGFVIAARERELKSRLLAGAIALLLIFVAFIVSVVIVGDRPYKDSVIVTQDEIQTWGTESSKDSTSKE